MFYSVHKRNKAEFGGIIKYSSISKTGIIDKFQKLRSEAASRFLMIDIDLDSDAGGQETVRAIEPCGKVKIPGEFAEYENKFGWTLVKPKDVDYGTIILESGMHNGEPFVIDSYDLDNPHAWKRRF